MPSSAGVALGTAAEKTILVTLGSDMSLLSDVSGLNLIDLVPDDNSPGNLAQPKAPAHLRDRLRRVLGDAGGTWDATPAGNLQDRLRRRWK